MKRHSLELFFTPASSSDAEVGQKDPRRRGLFGACAKQLGDWLRYGQWRGLFFLA